MKSIHLKTSYRLECETLHYAINGVKITTTIHIAQKTLLLTNDKVGIVVACMPVVCVDVTSVGEHAILRVKQ